MKPFIEIQNMNEKKENKFLRNSRFFISDLSSDFMNKRKINAEVDVSTCILTLLTMAGGQLLNHIWWEIISLLFLFFAAGKGILKLFVR